MTLNRGGVYQDPDKMGTNPRRFYPNGVIENSYPEVYDRTWRPRGSLFSPASDFRKTKENVRSAVPGGRRLLHGRGFAPIGVQDQGMPQGPIRPEAAHDSSPEVLADPRTLRGRAGQNAEEIYPNALPGVAGGQITNFGDALEQLWDGSGPVATVLFVSAGLVFVGGLLGIGPLSRAGSVAGAGLRGVNRGRQSTQRGAVEGVNKTFGGAVEAIEKISPGGRN